MSNPFVRVAQNDDNVKVRTPLVSSDLLASSGLVVGGVYVSQTNAPVRDTTTNVVSQDAFIRQYKPLSEVNPGSRRGLIIPVRELMTASGPYVSPGGSFTDNNMSTTTVASVLVKPLVRV
jgi:hypothetical protein